MQYEPAAEKATMISGQTGRPLTKEDYDKYPPTRRARTRLFVVLIIQLVLISLNFIGRVGSVFIFLTSGGKSVNDETTRFRGNIYDETTRSGRTMYGQTTRFGGNIYDQSTSRYRSNLFEETSRSEDSISAQMTVGAAILSLFMATLPLIFIIVFILVTVKYIRIGILIFAWLTVVELVLLGIYVVVIIVGLMTATSLMGVAGAGIMIAVFIIIVAGIASILSILTAVFAFKLAALLKTHQTSIIV